MAAPDVPQATRNEKVIKFAPTPELILVLESGADEFTLDNTWPDGAPKASHHREKKFFPVSKGVVAAISGIL